LLGWRRARPRLRVREVLLREGGEGRRETARKREGREVEVDVEF